MVSTLIGYDGRPMLGDYDVSWMVFYADVRHFFNWGLYLGIVMTDDFDESGFEDEPVPHRYLGMAYEKVVDNFNELGTATWRRTFIFEQGTE